MFLGSQLTEVSSRFPAHVKDVREFLQKEKFPVPSPEAIPQLLSRLESDAQFRADVGSLLRVALYQEREGIGYEDLLGILVAAVAGTEQDLTSESQETQIRELLRFVLQSRRSAQRSEPEPEEPVVSVETPPRESVAVFSAPVNSEPVLRMRGERSAAHASDLELRPTRSVAVAEAESGEPDDLVLPAFETAGLFASQIELERPWWGGYSARTVGVLCMLLGLCVGVMIHRVASAHNGVRAADVSAMLHRVVSAAETHVGRRAVENSSSKPETVDAVAPKESAAGDSNALAAQAREPATPGVKTESATGGAGSGSVAEGNGKATPSPASNQVASEVPPTTHTGVPVTVTKQVVTAFPSQSLDPGDPIATAAATKSTAQKASADITPANVIFSPAAKYPAAATAARVEGEVTVRAVVDTQGKVTNAHAVSGPAELRDAAEEAVQRWRYRPLLYNGKPTAVTTVAIVDFQFAK